MTAPTVHLVDASPFIFRAWFALPASLTDPSGRPVNAVRGFASFLIGLATQEQPTHLAVAFDESLTTCFRNELYPPYKAQREPPPAELEAQLADCRAFADAFGARTFASARYEADDLVGTLAEQLVRVGCSCLVFTPDKDFAQLVTERVLVQDVPGGPRMGPEQIEAKLGVRPDQVPDYLALVGDAVDNIPGIPGIGPKTASALLRHFGTIDALFDRLGEVERVAVHGAATLSRKLEGLKEQALLSRRLATIVRDAPVVAGPAELEYRGADRRRLEPLLERLGFRTMARQVPRWT